MRIKNVFAIALVGAALLFTACEKDSNDPFVFDLSNGVVITNEGSFGHSNASISFYDVNGDIVTNDVFFKVNNRQLGDVLQSMAVCGDTVYFVLNGSNKIEVARKSTCKEIATIENIASPRYMAVCGTKGYVSAWTNSEVVVIDLKSNAITKRISVGAGPEAMKVVGTKLFVANSGGWGSEKTVSVIDLTTETVVKTITVADCPRDMVIDRNGILWVICSGAIDWSNAANNTTSALCKVNTSTYEVTTMNINSNYHPNQLRINGSGSTIYYGAGYGVQGIFKMDIGATVVSSTPIVDEVFYGFAIDPSNETIVGMQAPSFSEAGKLKRYNATGELLREFTVGISPNNGYFVK